MNLHIGLIIYGHLDNTSGGFLYDRKLVDYLRSCGDSVEVLPFPWRNYPRHLLQNASLLFARRIRQAGFDLLLQDELNHPSLFLLNRLLQRRGGPPLISIVHHLRSSEDHPAVLRPIYRTVERVYLRSVDGMLFSSKATGEAVRQLAGLPRQHLVAWPGADHLPAFPARDAAAGQGRVEGGINLLCVGTVSARKGGLTLLKALALLRSQAWKLIFAGSLTVEPRFVRRLRKAVRRLGLEQQVRFAGYCVDADLRRLYASSDIFVMPSQHEGFGIVYLEAMGAGLPVIGSASGGAAELIQQGENGFLVEPGNAKQLADCLRQLENPAMRSAMSAAARQRWMAHPGWGDSMGRVRKALLQWSFVNGQS